MALEGKGGSLNLDHGIGRQGGEVKKRVRFEIMALWKAKGGKFK